MSEPVENLTYVGDAGRRGGTLPTRLAGHLGRGGWQTAFRRKVFQHVLGVSERPRTGAEYRELLRESSSQITQEIIRNFAFKCLATADFRDFEVWLIHKYEAQLWNKQKYPKKITTRDFSLLEAILLGSPLIPFSDRHISSIPDEAGVYLVFRI